MQWSKYGTHKKSYWERYGINREEKLHFSSRYVYLVFLPFQVAYDYWLIQFFILYKYFPFLDEFSVNAAKKFSSWKFPGKAVKFYLENSLH